jgi:hypothetical protein
MYSTSAFFAELPPPPTKFLDETLESDIPTTELTIE